MYILFYFISSSRPFPPNPVILPPFFTMSISSQRQWKLKPKMIYPKGSGNKFFFKLLAYVYILYSLSLRIPWEQGRLFIYLFSLLPSCLVHAEYPIKDQLSLRQEDHSFREDFQHQGYIYKKKSFISQLNKNFACSAISLPQLFS